jgi:hypothetical protein
LGNGWSKNLGGQGILKIIFENIFEKMGRNPYLCKLKLTYEMA